MSRASHSRTDPNYQKYYYLGLRYECMEHYSSGTPQCIDCGCHDLRELELDHTNGGGAEERRQYSYGIGGNPYHQSLRRRGYPDDLGLEVRCADCHRKRHKLEGKIRLSRITVSIEFSSVEPILDVHAQPLWEEA